MGERHTAAKVISAIGTREWERVRRSVAYDVRDEQLMALLDATAATIARAPLREREKVRLAAVEAWAPRLAEVDAQRMSQHLRQRHKVWAANATADESVAYAFRDVTGEARRDFARVVQEALRLVPRKWGRAHGVPRWWMVIDGGGRLRTEPLRGPINEDYYLDDLGVSGRPMSRVRKRLGDDRCAALVHGNAWLSWRLPLMSSGDSAAVVIAHHRSGADFSLHVPFTRRWHPVQWVRMAPPAVRAIEAIAAES